MPSNQGYHMRLMSRTTITAAAVGVVALVGPAIAAPLSSPAPDPYPRVAFVSRNDVPWDALTVGPIAGALGGVIAITSPSSLSADAATILTEYDPDLVIIVGGESSVQPAVVGQIAELGDWDIDRAAGAGRDQTAREIGRLIDKYGLARPAMLSTASGQNVGDLFLGGDFQAQNITTEDLTATGTLDATLPADQLPIAFGKRDRNYNTEYIGDSNGYVQLLDLTVTIPAGGGVLDVTANAAVQNDDATQATGVALYVAMDNNDPTDPLPFLDDTFALSLDQSTANDAGSALDLWQSTVEASGMVPISAGTHHIYVIGVMNIETDVHMKIPSISAVWYPNGTASPIGVVP